MTSGDDRLAPVTPLFGAKPGGASDEALQGAVSRHPAGTGRGDRHGVPVSEDRDGFDPRGRDGRPAAAKGLDDEWSAGQPGADETGAGASGARPGLRALPTYAAFAATTEGVDSGRADHAQATVSQGDDSSAVSAPGAEQSAFVRDAIDRRSPAERRTDERVAARKRAEAARRASDSERPGVEASFMSAEGPDARGSDDHDAAEPETLEAAARRAENISLHALSRRGVSSVEMARILTSRDLPDDVVAAEVERLERVGLLDDSELAENLVRSKQERKGLGKGAITAELRQRGVAQEAIEAAIADIEDDDEQARCDEWAIKRAGQLRGLDHATAERRLSGYLMRRGYRSEVIRRSIEKALPKGGSGGGVRFR